MSSDSTLITVQNAFSAVTYKGETCKNCKFNPLRTHLMKCFCTNIVFQQKCTYRLTQAPEF